MIEGRRIAVLKVAAHAATLLFLLCYFWVLIITALDFSRFYAALPYRYFATGALVVLVVLLPGKNWRLKFGLLLIIAVWLSVLPRVSWHDESNFFINAGTIRKGMTDEQVRNKMRPFLSVTSRDGTEVTFQTAPGSRERCVVKLKDGTVRAVQLRHK
ncbi:MAG TPA: hypothetical protein VK530_03105 [Candidatus Acidoferrum sp.]|nr:hypothetical protein [Candidatus Acidoferrum sp.]